ncbi:MAG: CotH kinase family protein [Eubacteriales bacterium]|nr:CotH kinase family protein [Eubacteriales bacterium]
MKIINSRKKVYIIIYIAILTLTLFSSCEKQDDISQDISEASAEESVVVVKYLDIISRGCSYTVNSPPADNYPDNDNSELTDGLYSSSGSFNDSAFAGWLNKPPIVTVDLGSAYDELILFEAGYLSTDEAGILPPSSISVEVSLDGQNWDDLGKATLPAYIFQTAQKAKLKLSSPVAGRYVRFTYEGEGHWIFLDEVSVSANLVSDGTSFSTVTLRKEDNPNLPIDFNFTINNASRSIKSDIPYIFPKDTELFFTLTHNGDAVKNGDTILSESEGFIYSRSNKLTIISKDGYEKNYKVDLGAENYGLPIVNITTSGGANVSETTEYTVGSVTVLSPDGNNLYDIPMQIRVRGNSTRGHPKKAYRLKLDESENVLRMGSAKNWVLLANHSDKSLLRNITAFKLARMFDDLEFTPDAEPCEVYLNGQYIGLYTIGDHIQAHENRVAIETDNAEVDTGYFLECDVRSAEENRPYFDVSGMLFSLLSPEVATSEQVSYINEYIRNIDDLLRKRDESVWEYLDMNSCVDWLLAKEICGATGMGFDAYMYKDKGEKLKFGPVWDYDLAFGNADFGEADRYDRFYLGGQWMILWLEYDSFREEFFKEWEKAKSEYIPKLIEGLWEDYEQLSDAANHNFRRWNILSTYVWPNPELVMNANTFKKQVEHVEWYITNHTEWMDGEYKRKYGYGS